MKPVLPSVKSKFTVASGAKIDVTVSPFLPSSCGLGSGDSSRLPADHRRPAPSTPVGPFGKSPLL
jgi:hypothetical protein